MLIAVVQHLHKNCNSYMFLNVIQDSSMQKPDLEPDLQCHAWYEGTNLIIKSHTQAAAAHSSTHGGEQA